MNATTLVKSFTVVLIFVAGVHTKAVEGCGSYLHQEDCIAKMFIKIAGSTMDKCDAKPNATDIQSCRTTAKEKAAEDPTCMACPSKSDLSEGKADCESKFTEYLSSLKATNKACAKASAPGIANCSNAARSCGMPVSSAEGEGDMMSILASLTNIGGSAAGAGGCNLYDPTLATRKAEFDDKIARLEDEKVEAVTKQAELDDELNQKKNEVNEKISDLEAEYRKAETEMKNQSMQEAADLQKKILASNKKIRDNLARIADKNTEIANLSFGIQQIMIESSDYAMNKACRDKVEAAKAAVMAPVTGADGKKRPPKYTMKESQKIKADLKHVETQCKDIENVKRGAQLKGIADKRRLLMVEIDTFQKSNQDEQKSIELDRKALEDKEKLLTENQKKALDEKNIKLDNLSKSVMDMAAIVDRKKKALDAKIKKRDEQIADLIRQKNEVKPIYDEVESSMEDSRDAATAYIGKCCPKKPATRHSGCAQAERGQKAAGESPSGIDTGTGI